MDTNLGRKMKIKIRDKKPEEKEIEFWLELNKDGDLELYMSSDGIHK
jgi:hypothetical protein